jgi:hypothetical protein
VLAALRAIGAPTEPTLARSGNWIIQIDPEATKLALDRVVAASGAQVWMHALVVDARMDDPSRIGAITVASHAGQRSVRAAAFVDASGEATLSVLAGVPLTHDSRRDGGQPASYPVRIGGVARDAVVDRELLTRLIAEHNAGATVPIPRADGGVLVRLPLSGDFWSMAIDLRTNGLDPDDLAAAERLGREQAWQLVALLRRHPGFEQAHLLATGPQVGVRETRRPLSRQDVQAADLRSGRQRGDGIARASWPMEVHHGPGRASFEPVGGAGHADVPLDALRADGVDNLLLAGRVVGLRRAGLRVAARDGHGLRHRPRGGRGRGEDGGAGGRLGRPHRRGGGARRAQGAERAGVAGADVAVRLAVGAWPDRRSSPHWLRGKRTTRQNPASGRT